MKILCLKKNLLVRNSLGFTLIELLVTMGIVGMMMTAVYAFHISSLRGVKAEEERVELQQDQRISIDFLTRELRRAGYDKTDSDLPRIVSARSNYIYFTADLNADGDIGDDNEHIAFCVFFSDDFGRSLSYITGSNSDVGSIGTTANPINIAHTHANHPHQALAPIEDIEFLYTLSDGSTTVAPTAIEHNSIRSVAITILSRADTPDPRWTDSQVYTPVSGTPFNGGNVYGDNFRRRMFTANVRFRNMGL
jgi:prepilin-type N-terminal cleavage/methylation domain-containing protein